MERKNGDMFSHFSWNEKKFHFKNLKEFYGIYLKRFSYFPLHLFKTVRDEKHMGERQEVWHCH